MVDRPKKLLRRVKMIGVSRESMCENQCVNGCGNECEINDEVIVNKIMKQNKLYRINGVNITVLRKSKLVNNKCSLVLEMDDNTYEYIMKDKIINIGWDPCPVYDEFGIIRCYNCCKYGHISKKCKKTKVCPKCGAGHDFQQCTSNVNMCVNCASSNKWFGLSLNVDHTCWDKKLCETYKRLENLQKNKYYK